MPPTACTKPRLPDRLLPNAARTTHREGNQGARDRANHNRFGRHNESAGGAACYQSANPAIRTERGVWFAKRIPVMTAAVREPQPLAASY